LHNYAAARRTSLPVRHQVENPDVMDKCAFESSQPDHEPDYLLEYPNDPSSHFHFLPNQMLVCEQHLLPTLEAITQRGVVVDVMRFHLAAAH
jgi:hypothetical protein